MAVISCERRRVRRHRTTLSITIDPHVLDALKRWMQSRGETNLSAAIEDFIDCGVRDTCIGCPAYESLPAKEKDLLVGKVGVGHQIIAENEKGESG